MIKLTRQTIVDQARTWIDTPYHHQGRLKGIGVDCIGLILGIGEEVGLKGFDRPEFLSYSRHPPRGLGMMKYFDEVCGKRLGLGEVEIADILIFFMNPINKRAQHIAIRSSIGLIHTYSNVGKVVEHGFNMEWGKRFICAYQFPCEFT